MFKTIKETKPGIPSLKDKTKTYGLKLRERERAVKSLNTLMNDLHTDSLLSRWPL